MEQKFRGSENGIDLQVLLDFCKKEGKIVSYRKGDTMSHHCNIRFASFSEFIRIFAP